MTDEDRIGFDEERILELMKEDREADTRRERRDIETEVLAETVWKASELHSDGLVLPPKKSTWLLEALIKAVENDDKEEFRRLRRKYYFLTLNENRDV